MLLSTLLACTSALSTPIDPVPVPQSAIQVRLTARSADGQPQGVGAWVVQGAVPVRAVELPAGECRKEEFLSVRGEAFADSLSLSFPAKHQLSWDAAAGAYALAGPLRGGDAAWSVADMQWTSNGRQQEVAGVLRFGAAPVVKTVERRSDGGVRLRWEASSDSLDVRTGALVCGSARDGVDLPWWAVPAYGGDVVLRSRRVHSSYVGDMLVIGEAFVETVIHLDAPVAVQPPASVGPKPPAPPRWPRWRGKVG